MALLKLVHISLTVEGNMKYLITTYKGHDIFYDEEDELFESAGIKKARLRDMKLALEFKTAKREYLRVYGTQILYYYRAKKAEFESEIYVSLKDSDNFIKLSTNNRCDWIIPYTKENLIIVKQLQKKLKAAEQVVKKAFNSQAKVVDILNKELSHVTK